MIRRLNESGKLRLLRRPGHRRRLRPGRLHRPRPARPGARQARDSAEQQARGLLPRRHDAGPDRAGEVPEAARRRAADDAADPHGVQADGSDRQGHRRLPVLPARPEPARGRLAHRHPDPARQPEDRAPRDPVPGLGRAGRGGRGRGRRLAGGGLDLLRRHGSRGRVQQRRRRRVARRLGARWPRDGGPQGVRRLARPGHQDRHAGALQPAARRRRGPVRDPDPLDAQGRLRHQGRPHRAAAGTGRDAVPLRARARPAVRPRGVGRGRQGAVRRRRGTAGQPAAPALRHQRLPDRHHLVHAAPSRAR